MFSVFFCALLNTAVCVCVWQLRSKPLVQLKSVKPVCHADITRMVNCWTRFAVWMLGGNFDKASILFQKRCSSGQDVWATDEYKLSSVRACLVYSFKVDLRWSPHLQNRLIQLLVSKSNLWISTYQKGPDVTTYFQKRINLIHMVLIQYKFQLHVRGVSKRRWAMEWECRECQIKELKIPWIGVKSFILIPLLLLIPRVIEETRNLKWL